MILVRQTKKIKGVKMGVFKCSCGVEIERSLSNGKKQKGCIYCGNKEAAKKNKINKTIHGDKYTKLYGVWHGMKDRCLNPNGKDYDNYMGSGVTICNEWINSFVVFRDWAKANGYKEGLEIDKDILSKEIGINPPIYSPQTCMFVTRSENQRSKRNTVLNKNIAKNIVDYYYECGFSETVKKYSNLCSSSVCSNVIYGGQWR